MGALGERVSISKAIPIIPFAFDELLYKLSIYLYLLSFDFILPSVHMSRVMRKPTFCICENKEADLLRGNREADQRLCFRYIHEDSAIPLLSISEISSL